MSTDIEESVSLVCRWCVVGVSLVCAAGNADAAVMSEGKDGASRDALDREIANAFGMTLEELRGPIAVEGTGISDVSAEAETLPEEEVFVRSTLWLLRQLRECWLRVAQ